MRPLLLPHTKKNPPKHRMVLGPWRSAKANKASIAAKKVAAASPPASEVEE